MHGHRRKRAGRCVDGGIWSGLEIALKCIPVYKYGMGPIPRLGGNEECKFHQIPLLVIISDSCCN